jgi:hypothetical protein
MKTIWKYQITKSIGIHQLIEMPAGAEIVRVGIQGNMITLWACVLPEEPKQSYLFYFVGTGHPVPVKDRYIGSATDGGFEWHVWEVSGPVER